MAIKQTAGREALGKFAPKFAELNDDVLFGQVLSLIHISEPTRRTPISYAVFCLKKKKKRRRSVSYTPPTRTE